MIFDENEEPLYDVDLFEEYFKYTYYSICQIMGIQTNPLMDVVHMILAMDMKIHDVWPFNYVSQMVDCINLGLERIKNNSDEIHFRHYFVLMHMLLYVRQELNLWVDNIRISEYDK